MTKLQFLFGGPLDPLDRTPTKNCSLAIWQVLIA